MRRLLRAPDTPQKWKRDMPKGVTWSTKAAAFRELTHCWQEFHEVTMSVLQQWLWVVEQVSEGP
eukprot:1859221-Prorocentrum_lima.AAC.1